MNYLLSKQPNIYVKIVAFFIVILFTPILFIQPQLAHATAPAPSWWSGTTCDTPNYPGSYALGTSFNGVIACGPGPKYQGGVDHYVLFTGATMGEFEWECVELSMRYMDLSYNVNPYGAAGGQDVVWNYPGSSSVLAKTYNNGSSLPTPGDIISIAAVPPSLYGHTSVVTGVNVTNGSGSVSTLEQNGPANSNGSSTISVTNNILGSSVSGWLHNPNYTSQTVTDTRIPIAADFTGDGHSDLLASSRRSDPSTNMLVFPSTGAWLGGGGLWSSPGEVRWADAKLTTGDLDGDLDGSSRSDVFAIQSQSNGAPNIYWLKSYGSGFAAPQLVGIPNLIFNNVKTWVSGDFNGDGHADILAVSKRGDTAPDEYVCPSTGAWLGACSLWAAPGNINFANAVYVPTNLDGDLYTDLLIIQPDANGIVNIYWSRSNGGSFDTPVLVGVPGMLFANVNSWVGGDFNHDGHGDLLASSRRGDAAPNFIVFPSTGAWLGGGGFWGTSPVLNWANMKIVPADLDGDGYTDLLTIQPDGAGTPYIYWTKSNGSSFNTAQLVGVPGLTFNNIHWQQ